MPRRLPTMEEAAQILAARRTRPPPRPPPPAGRQLAGLMRDLDARFGKGPGALIARWREVVGPDIARRTEPVKLTKGRGEAPGTLEIRVAGAAAAIIQHQGQEILERVNLFLGAGSVGKLRIVQGPLRQTGEARPTVRRTPPLDAAAEADLAAGMEGRPDGVLKERLAALGRGVLRQKR